MSRRIKMTPPTRYEIPAAPCVFAGCTTPPKADTLVCHFHARALQHLTQTETTR